MTPLFDIGPGFLAALKKLMTEEEISAAGQSPGMRAEQLSVAAFAELANAAACKSATLS